PWPAAGGGEGRNRARASRPDEETASRPRGVDVPGRPCKRGQGHSASRSSQLTPARYQRYKPRVRCCFSPIDAPCRPPLFGVVDRLVTYLYRLILDERFRCPELCRRGLEMRMAGAEPRPL